MKIYTGKNKRKAKEITFEELLASELKKNGFEFNTDCFSDGSASWVDIVQRDEHKQINIDFVFNGTKIDSIDVFESKIITIVDEENMKKLI